MNAETVYLRAYGGEVISRRVVEKGPGVVYVCRDEEYEQARRERREPILVGFLDDDVVTDPKSSGLLGSA